jgi:hypothetical protein
MDSGVATGLPGVGQFSATFGVSSIGSGLQPIQIRLVTNGGSTPIKATVSNFYQFTLG